MVNKRLPFLLLTLLFTAFTWLSTGAGKGNTSYFSPVLEASAQNSEVNWPMAGANPQRTSWVSEGVGGDLSAVWAKPIEAFIPFKVQLVAADHKIFISTAKGLYAIDSDTGDEKWVYPTSMPLGHSPTYDNGILYVGGFDKMVHAIDAATGARVWTFDGALAGYQTNPVVVNRIVYIGNNDGWFYAINTSNGSLEWKTEIGSPIRFSPAYAEDTIYIAADDTRVYALDAGSGAIKWTSEKLKVRDYHSWWPVVYDDYLMIIGSGNFREVEPGKCYECPDIRNDVFLTKNPPEEGELVGPLGSEDWIWDSGNSTPTIDMSKPNPNADNMPVAEYWETNQGWSIKPRVFVLDRAGGQEVAWDYDNDGKADLAPYIYSGHGNGYPAIISPNGVPYYSSNYRFSGAIPGGGPVAWKFGTPYVGLVVSPANGASYDFPNDEPYGISGGGSYLYWNLTEDRYIGAVDVTKPLVNLENKDDSRQWRYAERNWRLSGYDSQKSQYMWDPSNDKYYWAHAENVGPTPYNGKLYVHRGNSVIALAPGAPGSVLPTFPITSENDTPKPRSVSDLQTILGDEIAKIISKGSLRPGFWGAGAPDFRGSTDLDKPADYFHNPGENIYVLLRALPYLSANQQGQLRDYIQDEYSRYPLHEMNSIPWNGGAQRESAITPPQVQADLDAGGRASRGGFAGWKINPFNYYAMWLYAQEGLGDAATLFELIKDTTNLTPPDDSYLSWHPHVHNAYIAGYLGWLRLEKLAGNPPTAAKVNELNRLLALRASQFTWDLEYQGNNDIDRRYYYAYIFGMNFLYMTPELAGYLQINAEDKVTEAINQYNHMHPYWFVAKGETIQGENDYNPLQQYAGIIQAQAMILKQPFSEVERFLDVPAFETGDMYFINNLLAVLERACSARSCPTTPPRTSTPEPFAKPADANSDGKVDGKDYLIWLDNYGMSVSGGASNGDFNHDTKVDGQDYVIWSKSFRK